MSFSLGNTLEMKVKSSKDSTGFKKVKILESLNFSSSYNFLADSLKFQPVTMSGRTKIFGTNINFGARFDPYALDTTKTGTVIRVNQSVWSTQRKLLRLESANLNFGFSIGSETFKKKNRQNDTPDTTPDDQQDLADNLNPDDINSQLPSFDQDEQRGLIQGDDGYADFSIPWNISFNYSLRLTQDRTSFNEAKMDYDFKVTSDLNFNGNFSLTPKWKVNFSSGYSLDAKELAHTNIGISRDLHCWSMNFSLVPIGRYKSYFFTIRVNSSMLQDLKYEKRNSVRDNTNYYN